jgi:hypothetical protein
MEKLSGFFLISKGLVDLFEAVGACPDAHLGVDPPDMAPSSTKDRALWPRSKPPGQGLAIAGTLIVDWLK